MLAVKSYLIIFNAVQSSGGYERLAQLDFDWLKTHWCRDSSNEAIEEEYLMDVVRTIVKCLKIGDRERIHGENVILKRISKSTIRKRIE